MQDQRSFLISATSRLMDLLVVLFILIFLSWFLIVICILIRLETEGSPIFCQKRVGRYGKSFNCYKFRSMFIDTKNMATHEVSATQITRLGRFLRASKIDEFPQAWNIIKNEMTLVGPRPSLLTQDVIIAERKKRGILTIKPGITGWL
jgi:lipopolysaccharide/colanic/teichoic acid biosynthesis glycosyltransferase